MIMNRRAMAWGALIAVVVMIVTLGLCSLARAQDAAAPPYVKVEDAEVSEVIRESMVLADQLTVCAHELRRMQAAVEAMPEPPSRVVWLTSGLAAGLLIGASAALVAR